MREWHPDELELAEGGEARRDVADHLSWCSQCRALAGDYKWLEGGISATLDAAADEAPLPRPRWDEVKARLSVSRRRLASRQLLAVAAAVAMTCITLVVPSIVRVRLDGRRPGEPDRAAVQMPISISLEDGYLGESLTESVAETGTQPAARMTRASAPSSQRMVSLPFVPPPEPPEPGT